LLWANITIRQLEQFLPGFSVAGSTMAIGVGIALLLTVLSGLVPAWRAARMNVSQALRTVE